MLFLRWRGHLYSAHVAAVKWHLIVSMEFHPRSRPLPQYVRTPRSLRSQSDVHFCIFNWSTQQANTYWFNQYLWCDGAYRGLTYTSRLGRNKFSICRGGLMLKDDWISLAIYFGGSALILLWYTVLDYVKRQKKPDISYPSPTKKLDAILRSPNVKTPKSDSKVSTNHPVE